MGVLQKLVDRGNTVIVIEHNLDVIRLADHIIDMGPGGGRDGGRVMATGTPEEVAECTEGYTAKFLKDELEADRKAAEKAKEAEGNGTSSTADSK